MAKTKISEYSSTANSNTDIASINIDEGCAPSGINNAIRALMAQIHDLYAGTTGDTWPVAGGGTGSGTASGARTNLGLAIGTDVQAFNAALAAIAANNGTNMMKNRIINGAMVIDQRNAYAAINLATGGNYAVDRFVSNKGTAAATVAAQVQSASLANFEKCLVWNTSSGSAPASGDVNAIWQAIEGFNVSDFQFGTVNAQTFTFSFWLKCTSTGQIGIQIANGSVNRSYVTTINVVSANTWAQYSITVAGDTSGTWTKDNTTGLYVVWDMGSGTTSETSTTNAWQAGNYKRTSACIKPVATTGTIVYITGVQLEKGSTATSFDYRPYGTELQLCQRYFEKSYDDGTAPATATQVGAVMTSANGTATTGYISCQIFHKVTKRATPTITLYDNAGSSGKCTRSTAGVGSNNGQSAGSDSVGTSGFNALSVTGTSNQCFYVQWTSSAEL